MTPLRLMLTVVCFLGLAAPAAAQPDPLAPAAADPAAEQPADAAAVPANTRNDAIVRQVLDLRLDTPERILRAVRVLLDVGRPDAARPLLERLLDANPDAATLTALVDEFGSPFFLRLARERALEPLGTELAQRATDAARADVSDTTRIDDLLADLGDPSRRVRARAIDRLRTAGQPALAPLVLLLADDDRAAAHRAAGLALAAIGEESLPPLAAALAAGDPAFQERIAVALAQLGGPDAAAYLLWLAHTDTVPETVRTTAQAGLAQLFSSRPTTAQAAAHLRDRARAQTELAALAPTAEVQR